jgi:hypothetical protein
MFYVIFSAVRYSNVRILKEFSNCSSFESEEGEGDVFLFLSILCSFLFVCLKSQFTIFGVIIVI